MNFVFAIVFSIIFVVLDLVFLKIFQLSNYKLGLYINSLAKLNLAIGQKTPLKFTKRAKRQIFCDFFVKFASFFLIFHFLENFWWKWLIVVLLLLLSGIFVIFSFAISLPFEAFLKKRIVARAREKLKNFNGKIVAITGSFGKTSTKEFLAQLLRGQFSVCASPQSFNTEMGVCRTILENLKDSDEILILEFGARRKGDIARLCKMVGRVDHAIITPLGGCHLKSFKSMQAIEEAKFELCQNTRGVVIFNGNSAGSKRLFERHSGQKILCENGGLRQAKNVQIHPFGSSFELVLGKNCATCTCSVLGHGNIDNIVTAAAMCQVLGMSFDKICDEISRLKPPKHRLELISGGAVSVIDDSYNSNFAGFCEALEVLSQFSGRKFVVSPGIVELGAEQFETNRKIAEKVAEVADVFVIMNKTNKKALALGAEGKCQILFAETRAEQQQILRQNLVSGDVVLFENDLPDNFK